MSNPIFTIEEKIMKLAGRSLETKTDPVLDVLNKEGACSSNKKPIKKPVKGMKKKAAVEELFVDVPPTDKTFVVDLPKDTSAWMNFVLQEVHKALAGVTRDAIISTDIRNIDEIRGYAIGNVSAKGPVNTVFFPFVIKDFKLFPIDLIMVRNKLYLITKYYLNKFLGNTGIVGQVTSPKEDFVLKRPDLFDNIAQQQYYPDEVIDFVRKQGSLSENVLYSVKPEDKAYIIQCMREEVPYTVKVASDETASEVINRFLAVPEVGEVQAPVKENDIFFVQKTASNNYRVLTSSTKMFNPQEFNWTYKVAADMLPQSMGQVMPVPGQGGQGGPPSSGGPGNAPVTPGQIPNQQAPQEAVQSGASNSATSPEELTGNEDIKQAEIPGEYKVYLNSGQITTGYVFPFVVDFNMQPQQGQLFVGQDGTALQESIEGELLTTDSRPPEAKILNGHRYCFAFWKDNVGIATLPFDVVDITSYKDMTAIGAMFMGQQPIVFIKSNVKTITPGDRTRLGEYAVLVKPEMQFYYVPKNSQAVELYPPEVMIMPLAEAGKMASRHVSNSNTSYIEMRKSGSHVYLSGKPLESAGFDTTTPLDKFTARFYLNALGVNDKLATAYINLLEKKAHMTIYGINRPFTTTEMGSLMGKVGNVIDSPKVDFRLMLKTAADINTICKKADYQADPMCVDSVLSLGLLKPENMSVFIKNMPMLEHVESMLASLLLSARLGMDMPDNNIKEALSNLSKVIEALRNVG